MIFATYYELKGENYRTTLFARDVTHAQELIELRGMGEKLQHCREVENVSLASDYLRLWRWGDAMHAACWLGMIGCASKSVDGFELLHDQGLIHSIAHLTRIRAVNFTKENLTDKLRFLILLAFHNAKNIESKVPGFTPCSDDLYIPLDENLAPESMMLTASGARNLRPDWYEKHHLELSQWL